MCGTGKGTRGTTTQNYTKSPTLRGGRGVVLASGDICSRFLKQILTYFDMSINSDKKCRILTFYVLTK